MTLSSLQLTLLTSLSLFLSRQGVGKVFVEAVTLNALLERDAHTYLASEKSLKGISGASLPKDFGRTYFGLQAKRTGALW